MMFLKRVVEHRYFSHFIMGIIILNTMVLGLDTTPLIAPAYKPLLYQIDIVCIGIFAIEAFLKIMAWRTDYFKSGWNIFDLLIVLIAILPFGHSISVFRALRILRAFRLIEKIPAFKKVISALFISFPGILSTAGVMLLVYFVFGVITTELFGIDFPQWFGHLGRSMFSLFQIMTLESWSMGIVRPVMQMYPYAWVVFVIFILISTFVLLNLIIGIVVDALAHIKATDDEPTQDDVLTKLKQLEEKLDSIQKKLTP